jgi:hypothetical protein
MIFSAPFQTGPGAHPALLTVVKRPLDHPLSYSAKIKERVELYLYSLSELS